LVTGGLDGGLYVLEELTVSQAIEPVLYGHSTGLSPFAVVVSAIFWSWLWGPIGLILSDVSKTEPACRVAGPLCPKERRRFHRMRRGDCAV